MVQVQVYLIVAMQQPLQALAKGYARHIRGCVDAGRLPALAAKFDSVFSTSAPYTTRQSRRRRGLANYYFFAHPKRGSPQFDWLLLATDGKHPPGVEEDWLTATKAGERLRYQDRFEAVSMPAKGGQPRWTWRIAPDHYSELVIGIQDAIRKRGGDDELRQIIHGIHRMPGFRGVRGQVVALRKLIAGEWKRGHDGADCPYLPPRVQGYQRYRAAKSVPAEMVIERMKRGLTPIDFEWRRNAEPATEAEPELEEVLDEV